LRARKRRECTTATNPASRVSSIPAPFPLLLPAAARNLRSSTLATAPPPAQPHPRLRAAHRRSPHPPHGRPNVASPRLHPRSCETLQDDMPAGRPGRRGSGRTAPSWPRRTSLVVPYGSSSCPVSPTAPRFKVRFLWQKIRRWEKICEDPSIVCLDPPSACIAFVTKLAVNTHPQLHGCVILAGVMPGSTCASPMWVSRYPSLVVSDSKEKKSDLGTLPPRA
jgi:hypothetical protein